MENIKTKIREVMENSILEIYERWSNYEEHLEKIDYMSPKLISNHLYRYISEGMEILDIGCGTGLFGKSLIEKSKCKIEVVGIDFSNEMLKEADKKNIYKQLSVHNVIEPLPFSEKSFDVCVSVGVTEHIKNLDDFIYNMGKISSSIIAFNISLFPYSKENWNNYTKNQAFKAVENAGYVPIDVFVFCAFTQMPSLAVIAKRKELHKNSKEELKITSYEDTVDRSIKKHSENIKKNND